jgi:AGZA family xanthine/uracil permease-like MFS transporter
MSYIIFVNPAILGLAGVPGLEGQGLPFDGVLTSTCLVAGVMTIIMGLYTNRAYGIAPGLVVVRLFQGQAARVHPLTYASAIAFTLYFLVPLLQQEFDWI